MADNSTLGAILARLEPAQFDADDHNLLDRLLATTREVDRCFTQFEFSAAVQALYGFFWNDFCDWYVEVAKAKLQDESTKANCLALEDLALRQTLLLLHPFIPFITEELWHLLGYGVEGSFLIRDARIEHTSQLVETLGARGLVVDLKASAASRTLQLSASKYRADKAAAGLAGVRLPVVYYDVKPEFAAFFTPQAAAVYARIFETESFQPGTMESAVNSVTSVATFYLPRPAGDAGAEKARLVKEIETVAKHIVGTEARLANEAFVSKAPPAVLAGARKQLADQQAKKAELERLLSALG
jgi:valyl-tRNA synthetase